MVYLANNILITSSLAIVFLFNFLQRLENNGESPRRLISWLNYPKAQKEMKCDGNLVELEDRSLSSEEVDSQVVKLARTELKAKITRLNIYIYRER